MEPVPGYVLHVRPYRERSALVELLTGPQGRVGCVVRGRDGTTRPFTRLDVVLRGQGELLTAASIDEVAQYRLAPRQLALGLYLNEITYRLCPRGLPAEALFEAYGHTLERLAGGASTEPALRRYELTLLDTIGYGLSHEPATADGEALRPEGLYRCHAEAGPVPADRRDAGHDACVHGSTLIALAQGELASPAVLEEAKRLLRHLIAHHLGSRPLMSRKLWRPSAGHSSVQEDP
ncbi:MAG: DNA repair protein RecO [Ectothiorhodospiraceae bacterium]|jgi:DNA repair protein RecO (recombination protein O)|nr:DNA repair protein RecO [Ectothiorhodospiraceae bacterium]